MKHTLEFSNVGNINVSPQSIYTIKPSIKSPKNNQKMQTPVFNQQSQQHQQNFQQQQQKIKKINGFKQIESEKIEKEKDFDEIMNNIIKKRQKSQEDQQIRQQNHASKNNVYTQILKKISNKQLKQDYAYYEQNISSAPSKKPPQQQLQQQQQQQKRKHEEDQNEEKNRYVKQQKFTKTQDNLQSPPKYGEKKLLTQQRNKTKEERKPAFQQLINVNIMCNSGKQTQNLNQKQSPKSNNLKLSNDFQFLRQPQNRQQESASQHSKNVRGNVAIVQDIYFRNSKENNQQLIMENNDQNKAVVNFPERKKKSTEKSGSKSVLNKKQRSKDIIASCSQQNSQFLKQVSKQAVQLEKYHQNQNNNMSNSNGSTFVENLQLQDKVIAQKQEFLDSMNSSLKQVQSAKKYQDPNAERLKNKSKEQKDFKTCRVNKNTSPYMDVKRNVKQIQQLQLQQQQQQQQQQKQIALEDRKNNQQNSNFNKFLHNKSFVNIINKVLHKNTNSKANYNNNNNTNTEKQQLSSQQYQVQKNLQKTNEMKQKQTEYKHIRQKEKSRSNIMNNNFMENSFQGDLFEHNASNQELIYQQETSREQSVTRSNMMMNSNNMERSNHNNSNNNNKSQQQKNQAKKSSNQCLVFLTQHTTESPVAVQKHKKSFQDNFVLRNNLYSSNYQNNINNNNNINHILNSSASFDNQNYAQKYYLSDSCNQSPLKKSCDPSSQNGNTIEKRQQQNRIKVSYNNHHSKFPNKKKESEHMSYQHEHQNSLEQRHLLPFVQADSVKLCDFNIQKILGSGAQAHVRLVKYLKDQQLYAMKIYQKNQIQRDQEDKKKSIYKEIQVLSQLNHANILQYYHKIETRDAIHLIVEYVGDTHLQKFFSSEQNNKEVTENQVKNVFLQLAQGIYYLHSKNIIHRDLKLENVLVQKQQNNRFKVKLIDFGFSTLVINSVNYSLNQFCGTPSYMAPEIVQKKQYQGPPVDVWAFGIMLYKIVVGQYPFSGKVDKLLYKQIAQDCISFPEKCKYERITNNLEFQDLIFNVLCKDPQKRYTISQVVAHPWFNSH